MSPLPASAQPPAARPRRAWLFWLLLLAGLLVFLYLIRSVLLPFVAGFAVAYFLDPVVDWLQRRGLSRLLATALVSLAFVLVVVGILLVLVPLVINQVSQFIADLPSYLEAARQWLDRVTAYVSQATGFDLQERLEQGAADPPEAAVGGIGELLGSLVAGGLALANLLSLLLITPIVALFLLLNWDAVARRVDSLLPRPQLPVLRQLLAEMDAVLAGFLRGQAAVCAIMAIYYAAALSLGGLRYGLLVGLLAGLLTFVPYVGALTGLVLTTGLALVQFDTLGPVILLLGLYFAGQAVEGNILTPRVVGRAIGLHDLWLIFAVLVGGALFGIWGVLLAVPVAGCIGVLVRFAVRRYLASPYYRGSALPPADPAP